MSFLSSLLPPPKHTGGVSSSSSSRTATAATKQQQQALALVGSRQQQQQQQQQQRGRANNNNMNNVNTTNIPSYGQRGPPHSRWMPKTQADFGDGGSYPEIHVAQYPLGMGRKDGKLNNGIAGGAAGGVGGGRQLALLVDTEGNVQYDQVVRQGQDRDQVIFTKYTDMIEAGDVSEEQLRKPDESSDMANSDRTRSALEKITQAKITSSYKAGPKFQAAEQEKHANDAVFYRYTPAKTAAGNNNASGADTRIIRITDAPVDPMAPAKFRVQKVGQRAPSPPVPILHAPAKKLTKEEAADWYIPAVVSNWKNPGGTTIPLDKRLAADGRGLQEVQINDKFAKISEALYIAERTAREEIEKRAQYEQMRIMKQKKANEDNLLEIARTVRSAATRGAAAPAGGAATDRDQRTADEAQERNAAYYSSSEDEESDYESDEDRRDGDDGDAAYRKREELRRSRRLEREFEKRQQKMRKSQQSKDRQHEEDTSFLRRDEDRDITEKVALGQAAKTSSIDAIDSRLFNFASGETSFGDDDSYNIYDQPLLRGSSASQIYMPRKSAMEELGAGEHGVDELLQNKKFTRRFAGSAEEGEQSTRAAGPVQFERERKMVGGEEQQMPPPAAASSSSKTADPFGFSALMTETKRKGTLDHIGKKGFMSAAAGGSSLGAGGDISDYRNSKRSRIDFAASSSGSKSSSSSSDRRGQQRDHEYDEQESQDSKRRRERY